MNSSSQLAAGDRVRVSGPPGAVIATIEAVTAVADLPAVPGYNASELENVKQILNEQDILIVAAISYEYAGRSVCFMASYDRAGNWTDRKGHALTIEHIDPPQTTLFGAEYPA